MPSRACSFICSGSCVVHGSVPNPTKTPGAHTHARARTRASARSETRSPLRAQHCPFHARPQRPGPQARCRTCSRPICRCAAGARRSPGPLRRPSTVQGKEARRASGPAFTRAASSAWYHACLVFHATHGAAPGCSAQAACCSNCGFSSAVLDLEDRDLSFYAGKSHPRKCQLGVHSSTNSVPTSQVGLQSPTGDHGINSSRRT